MIRHLLHDYEQFFRDCRHSTLYLKTKCPSQWAFRGSAHETSLIRIACTGKLRHVRREGKQRRKEVNLIRGASRLPTWLQKLTFLPKRDSFLPTVVGL